MKKFFFKYPITKMISLLLAMTLWLMVHGDRQKEITVDVPIKFEDLPGELMTVGAVPQTIRVRLKGSQTRLSKIDDSYFTPHALNLSKARPGINTFWVYEEDFKVPFGVSVMRVYPQAIRLELDFAQIQWVPVEAKLEGDLDLGYTIDQISIVPSKVRIRIPRKKIGEVKTIYTEEISIAGKNTNFEGEYFLDDLSVPGEILQKKVVVVVKVLENETIKTITLPIQKPVSQSVFSLVPESVTFKVRGRESLVRSLEENIPIISLDPQVFELALKNHKTMEVPLIYQEFPDLDLSIEPTKVKVVFDPK